MATGKKITQFKIITDVDLAKDTTLFVAGDANGALYKPSGIQMRKLISDIVTAVAPGIFNSMWATIKASEQIITARWKFSIINLTTTPNNTKQQGDVWYDGSKVSVQKTQTEDIVTSLSNPFLVGSAERLMSADNSGGVQALHGLIEEIVTDNDIINACMAATYNSTNLYTSTITPANNKTFYKGQMCRTTSTAQPYMYKAISNNTVLRIPLV